MIKIASLPKKDREALFINTSSKNGLNVSIIEKDFWVCYLLDYLFHRCKWKNYLAFKGGTSLSKCFGLIYRFSEDIDLILDWSLLGYSKDELWKERTNSKQDLFNNTANEKTELFLNNEFLPQIISDLKKELKTDFKCYIDKEFPQTIMFEYDCCFKNKYILPIVKLEIGSLAAWTPSNEEEITPYCAIYYPSLFDKSFTKVLTVQPQRTFWEKVTILHREANRKEGSKFPYRYSRHYYDLFCMAKTSVKYKAFKDLDLLNKVVKFKMKFYRCNWAHYEDINSGSIKLIPKQCFLKDLKDDYNHMMNMIYGEKPDFDSLMDFIKKLEIEINNVLKK